MAYLDVLIVTHGVDGLEKVAEMNPPEVPEVEYIVSWQGAPGHYDIPSPLRRKDIHIHPTPTKGLGSNRNESISHASAEICLIADNDIHYTPRQLSEAIEIFKRHPEVDLFTFMFDGAGSKPYPKTETDISTATPKGYNPCSIEMAFRLSKVKGKIAFREDFGVGARYESAEDGFFFCDCQRAGLNCRFFPHIITYHAAQSTGNRPITKPSILLGEGAFIRHRYGLTGLPRVPLFVWRNWRRGRIKLLRGLWNVLRGFLFVKIR